MNSKNTLQAFNFLDYNCELKKIRCKLSNLLGYNYQSSQWYENSYIIFDKNYQKIKIQKEENRILKRFKSLFN